jgi:hypothetical protein
VPAGRHPLGKQAPGLAPELSGDFRHLEFAGASRYVAKGGAIDLSSGKPRGINNMSSKLGGWLVLLGGVIALGGLIALPAAMRGGADRNLLGVGMSIFAMGTLTMAAGTYLKAQDLQASTRPGKPVETEKKGGCDRCHAEPPAIQCKVHQLHLCDTCLASHYDFRSCVYVPSTRRTTIKPGRAMVAKVR